MQRQIIERLRDFQVYLHLKVVLIQVLEDPQAVQPKGKRKFEHPGIYHS